MRLSRLHIREGMFEREFVFSDGANLIFSSKNSCGKTTLLRLILYSLGYSIPGTRKFRLSNCEAQIELVCDSGEPVKLTRTNSSFIELERKGKKQTFVLPDQQHDLQEIIFNTNNSDILNNLLGAFYIDQEKGWTLLNRGVVIGSIHFNIEELIRGLSGKDCTKLIEDEKRLSKELSKYRQLFSVAKYRENVMEESGTLVSDDYEETTNIELNQLLFQQQALKHELKRIDHALADNRHFKAFIAEMKILIELDGGDRVPVTENNVVGLSDSIDFLIAKRKRVALDLAEVTSKLNALQSQVKSEEEQLAFYSSESMIEAFDRKIASMPINAIAVEKEISRLEKSLKTIREEISYQTKSGNSIVASMYQNVLKYAIELGIGDSESIVASYLFTSNLKELSGAVLHKTVFAFRLAYILEIEKALNIRLPIIMDSPSGKEVDQENIRLMMNVIKRDFSENQIIIASIFKYDFHPLNIIHITDRLIPIS